MIYLITFLLSGISMLYEFTLAQLISLFFGSTFEIYAITIGVYTFSLGLGALYFERNKALRPNNILFLRTELGLSFVALVAPFLIVWLASKETLESLGLFAKVAAFGPVFLCGWLSGIELPCLLSLSKKNTDQEVLFVDFAGMFVGAVLFSLLLVDKLGPLTLMWLLCLTNVVLVFVFLISRSFKLSLLYWFTGFVLMSAIGVCLFKDLEIIIFFKRVHGV